MCTASKQQLNDALLTMMLGPSAFLLKDFGMQTPPQLRFMKRTLKLLSEVIRIVEKFSAAQQLIAMLTPSMVSVMSNDDRCLVCGQTGHFGYHCPNVQCYSCDEFSDIAQDSSIRNTKAGLVQGHDAPTPEGTDHTPQTMSAYM